MYFHAVSIIKSSCHAAKFGKLQILPATICFMKYLLILLTLFLAGCSVRHYDHTEPKILIIKSPKIKFADLAYLRNTDDAIEVELFVAGKSIEKITINHLICVNAGCLSKSAFNEEYLHASYPSDILQNILLSKPIYEGEGMSKTAGGFEQNIVNEDVSINYRVNAATTFFTDRKNHITFKMKQTQLRSDDE
jgi:hypothetical protein